MKNILEFILLGYERLNWEAFMQAFSFVAKENAILLEVRNSNIAFTIHKNGECYVMGKFIGQYEVAAQIYNKAFKRS